MKGRYTERAEKVLAIAHNEAKRMGHQLVGTEHILLGLIQEGEGIAAQTLIGMGLDLDKIRSKFKQITGGVQPFKGEWGLPPELKGFWSWRMKRHTVKM